MEAFKAGTIPLLIATDVAARGLDIPDVEVRVFAVLCALGSMGLCVLCAELRLIAIDVAAPCPDIPNVEVRAFAVLCASCFVCCGVVCVVC